MSKPKAKSPPPAVAQTADYSWLRKNEDGTWREEISHQGSPCRRCDKETLYMVSGYPLRPLCKECQALPEGER